MQIEKAITSQFPNWNECVYTDSDFYNYVDDNRIIYAETDLLDSPGRYIRRANRDIILVNSYSVENRKTWIRFHELLHCFMSQAGRNFSTSTTRKYDYQANIFSSVALIPFFVLKKYSVAELVEYFNHPKDLIICRYQVFERYGI